MKKILSVLLALCAVFVCLGLAGCDKADDASKTSGAGTNLNADGVKMEPDPEPAGATNFVQIDVKGYGSIIVELYPDIAPITVSNFKTLVAKGFYNGLTFHRVIFGFMIQGGDPNGNGSGGPGWTIKGEFSANGVENNLKHTRGVISMARQGNPQNDAPYRNTAGSQFFIMHQDYPSLNGQYAAFGKVVKGLIVVDKIAAVDTNTNDKPLTDVIMEKVFFVNYEKGNKTEEPAETKEPAETEEPTETKEPAETEEIQADPTVKMTPDPEPEGATNFVRIDVKDYGPIVVELYPDIAPITVANFKTLVASGYYDGLIFHRVISGFMIQGGDPNGNGTGGPGWTIKGEFSANGVKNDLEHTRGVISMARQGNPYNDAPYRNTAGSQFFIMHADYPSLNGQYAAFGKVVSGMEIVDQIAAVETGANDKPVTDVVMERVYFVEGANG